jgi:hypothetical protein
MSVDSLSCGTSGPHRRDHIFEWTAVDGHDTGAEEIRSTHLSDDVRAIGERVHPDRIGM